MKKVRTSAIPSRPAITSRGIAGKRELSALRVTQSPQSFTSITEYAYHRTPPTIGVMLHDLNSPFISAVLNGIDLIASAAGYNVIIACSAKSRVKEALNAGSFLKRRVDGVIVSRVDDYKDTSNFNIFHEKKVPVIFFGGADQYPGGSVVTIDNAGCSYQATQHLIGQGCKRIVLVTGDQNRKIYAERFQGYAEALNDNGFQVDKDLILTNELNKAGGILAAEAIMNMYPRPDGAFITDDITAAVCMNTLTDAGWSIPEDLALVGFNDDFISRAVIPQITTIQYPGVEIGEIAARSLIDQLKGYHIDRAARIVVHSTLLKRASSQRSGQF